MAVRILFMRFVFTHCLHVFIYKEHIEIEVI